MKKSDLLQPCTNGMMGLGRPDKLVIYIYAYIIGMEGLGRPDKLIVYVVLYNRHGGDSDVPTSIYLGETEETDWLWFNWQNGGSARKRYKIC